MCIFNLVGFKFYMVEEVDLIWMFCKDFELFVRIFDERKKSLKIGKVLFDDYYVMWSGIVIIKLVLNLNNLLSEVFKVDFNL